MKELQKLEKLKDERVLLLRGNKSFTDSGAEAWLSPHLNPETTRSFFGFHKNPDIKDLYRGMKLFREFKPTMVLAVGGGSVIDMAKLIRFFGSIHADPGDWLDGNNQSVSTGPSIPLLAVPTTSGAGAEATHFAVLYREEVKYSVAHPFLQATEVMLRPELTLSMTAFQAAVSGLDAFFQGVESWWSRNATAESRQFSEEAVKLVLDNLSDSVHNAAPSSRKAMQKAAFLAGKAINIAKTTSCHAFSYILTTHFGLPHGQAVAVTFPYILDYNLNRMNPEDAEALRSLLNMKDIPPIGFAEDFIGELGINIKLPVQPEELQSLWKANVNLERLKNNPVNLDEAFFQSLSVYAAS